MKKTPFCATSEQDQKVMFDTLGIVDFDDLFAAIPDDLRCDELDIPEGLSEMEMMQHIRKVASKNSTDLVNFCGAGFYDHYIPSAVDALSNRGEFYTAYTPYQPEASQGTLQAAFEYQTAICRLTDMEVANASLFDGGTALIEGIMMALRQTKRNKVLVDEGVSPIYRAMVRCYMQNLSIDCQEVPLSKSGVADRPAYAELLDDSVGAVVFQNPNFFGCLDNLTELIEKIHEVKALAILSVYPIALSHVETPGAMGADIVTGEGQSLGLPLNFGGPYLGFMATRKKYVRKMPGRIVGETEDGQGRRGYVLTLQAREQHIRREKATSNICTAQVLLAVMASMYAVYHGPEGLRRIARRVHTYTVALAKGLRKLGHNIGNGPFFDTLKIRPGFSTASALREVAMSYGINLRDYGDGAVGVSLDEKTTRDEVAKLLQVFNNDQPPAFDVDAIYDDADAAYESPYARQSDFLTHAIFNTYHSETDLLRYLYRLQQRDLSLATAMIPLGSCTMKLNGTSEMMPITWPEFATLHPRAPKDQTRGYAALFEQLKSRLAEITGLPGVSFQPNSGASGEYAGLMVVRAYHHQQGQPHRDVCLIPVTAHGTNAASAVMAGMRVVPVASDENGNISMDDLVAKASQNRNNLAAIMITYPSTAGVFEETVREVCDLIHECGGQVYMDGANMNAQVGLCRPGDIGADVCHLNLHKTFSIPHGGGGPGVGPICAADHLKPFLPTHTMRPTASESAITAVSAAPYGSPSILPIPYVYITLMGAAGLTKATQVAILNANYMAKRLENHYPILYTGRNGRVAHEFILDCRPFEKSADVKIDDIAKRLIDYGFHAPTMSWPVAGALMIEPTESEPKTEIDRFCDAMIAIREEIRAIEEGRADREDNVLKGAPFTAEKIASDDWPHPYTRRQAAYPLPWVREHKFWPAVGRIDNVWGDRNLFCTCPAMEMEDGEA